MNFASLRRTAFGCAFGSDFKKACKQALSPNIVAELRARSRAKFLPGERI